MTEITFDEKTHRYRVNGNPVPSVTQVLGVLDKSGPLMWWAQGIGVQGVCQLRDQLEGELPWDDPEGIVKLLVSHKISCNHVRDVAASRGTSLHTALEQYLLSQVVPNAIDYPVEDRGYIQALAKALLELRPKVILSEQMVASAKYGYAGRFDLLADIDGQRVLCDLKTGKGIYPETQFPQLEAYAEALAEMGGSLTDARWIIRLDADGDFEVGESYATFDDFLAIKSAFDARQRLKDEGKRMRAAAKKALKEAA